MKHTFVALFAVLILLSGCSVLSQGETKQPKTTSEKKREQIGSLTGDEGLIIFGGKREKQKAVDTGIGVNAFLWRATLDTISFMPLTSVDPFGGVILTDWYADEAATERSKLNVFIYDRALRSDALKVTAFKQVRTDTGWRDVPVNAQVSRQIEDAILTRARQLKIAAQDAP